MRAGSVVGHGVWSPGGCRIDRRYESVMHSVLSRIDVIPLSLVAHGAPVVVSPSHTVGTAASADVSAITGVGRGVPILGGTVFRIIGTAAGVVIGSGKSKRRFDAAGKQCDHRDHREQHCPL